jgi:hypothetical protein
MIYQYLHLSEFLRDHLSLVPSRHSSLEQLGEVGRAQSRDRIPSRSSVPACVRDDRAAVGLAVEARMTIASSATTENNVVERIGVRVEQRVQETKSRLLGPQACVVKESDNSAEGGGGAGSALVALQGALIVDTVTETFSNHVSLLFNRSDGEGTYLERRRRGNHVRGG